MRKPDRVATTPLHQKGSGELGSPFADPPQRTRWPAAPGVYREGSGGEADACARWQNGLNA